MACKRFVYEYMNLQDGRTYPPAHIRKPVRYRDEHDGGCDHNCSPIEAPWPAGEEWPDPFKGRARGKISSTEEERPMPGPMPFAHIVDFYLAQSRTAKGFALERASERCRGYAHASWWGGYWIPSFES